MLFLVVGASPSKIAKIAVSSGGILAVAWMLRSPMVSIKIPPAKGSARPFPFAAYGGRSENVAAHLKRLDSESFKLPHFTIGAKLLFTGNVASALQQAPAVSGGQGHMRGGGP